MADKNVSYDTTNLMIPAFGQVRMVTNIFNPTNGYELDVNSLVINSIPFKPQSVTIDASDVPTNQTVTFLIKQINFKKVIKGGNTITFNFPSIVNMVFTVTPSDNTSSVRSFWYNYPSFTDTAIQDVQSTGGTTQNVNVVSPNPLPVTMSTASGVVTQSVLTVISAGIITIPANASRAYLLLQNNSTTGVVSVSLAGNAGVTMANGFLIQPGGSIELRDYVPKGAITLIGSIASNAAVILAEGV